MKMRLAAALAALCACREGARIQRERLAREATTDLTGIAIEQNEKWVRPAPPPICEVGAKTYCFGPGPALPGGGPLYKHCMLGANGRAYWNNAECNTPLVVAFDGSPVEFTRSSASFAIGLDERTEWVSPKTPWLALDRDGSGCIESARELFAGFAALAELDTNGDGRIDARDPAFAELVLWSDRDQDKRCTPDELSPLSLRLDALAIVHLDPDRRLDGSSYEGETATLANGARLVDVHLAAFDLD